MFGCATIPMALKSSNGSCSGCVTRVISAAQSRSPSLTSPKQRVCLLRYVVDFLLRFREWSLPFGQKQVMTTNLLGRQVEAGFKKALRSSMSPRFMRQPRMSWILKSRSLTWCWRLTTDSSIWTTRFSAHILCPTPTPKCRHTLSTSSYSLQTLVSVN